jgi:hypothetical protein
MLFMTEQKTPPPAGPAPKPTTKETTDERVMRVAREVMRRRHGALRELAK